MAAEQVDKDDNNKNKSKIGTTDQGQVNMEVDSQAENTNSGPNVSVDSSGNELIDVDPDIAELLYDSDSSAEEDQSEFETICKRVVDQWLNTDKEFQEVVQFTSQQMYLKYLASHNLLPKTFE